MTPGGTSRGRLVIATCRGASGLAERVFDRYLGLALENRDGGGRTSGNGGAPRFLPSLDWRFANGETGVRLSQDVDGADVYVFQSVTRGAAGQSPDENLMALLLAVRACREFGALHVTAVTPYLAYSRQDKATHREREPVSSRLVADLAITAGIDGLIAWHPHASQIRGFYGGIRAEFLPPDDLFVQVLNRFAGRDDAILVAPDRGVHELVSRLGERLGLRCAYAAKRRLSPDDVAVMEIGGNLTGARVAIIVDDLIAGLSTVSGLLGALAKSGEVKESHLLVSHNAITETGLGRLAEMRAKGLLGEVWVTDSLPDRLGAAATYEAASAHGAASAREAASAHGAAATYEAASAREAVAAHEAVATYEAASAYEAVAFREGAGARARFHVLGLDDEFARAIWRARHAGLGCV